MNRNTFVTLCMGLLLRICIVGGCRSEVVEANVEELKKQTDYFDALLDEERKHNESISLNVKAEDVQGYIDCITFINGMASFPRSRFSSVSHALGILVAATRLKCQGIVEMCFGYLACVVWTPSERTYIRYVCRAKLALPVDSLPDDVNERLKDVELSPPEWICLFRTLSRAQRFDTRALEEMIDKALEHPSSELMEQLSVFFHEEWSHLWSEMLRYGFTHHRLPQFHSPNFKGIAELACKYGMCSRSMVVDFFSTLSSRNVFWDKDIRSVAELLVSKILSGEVILSHPERKTVAASFQNYSRIAYRETYCNREQERLAEAQVRALASTLGWESSQKILSEMLR